MTQFVKPTSFRKHKTFGRQISRSSKQLSGRRKPRMTVVTVLISVILILGGLIDWLFIRNKDYLMTNINIVSTSPVPYVETYYDELYKILQGKHYYLTKMRRVVPRMITAYPLLSGAQLEVQGPNTYRLSIQYIQPELRLLFQNREYGLVGDTLHLLTGSSSGLMLRIPSYFTGMTLSGLFHQIPAKQLTTQYYAIVRGLSDKFIQSMTYHVASKQIQVNTTQQELYFNIGGNIFEQLKLYRVMLQHKKQVPDQRIVDLGSVINGVISYP